MLRLIIPAYYCPATFLPLADTPPAPSCPICWCSGGWLKMRKAVPVRICSSPSKQRSSFCSCWNLSNPLPTHAPAICSGLLGAVAWEQLHTTHPQKHVKRCFLSSLEGGTLGRVWSSLLSWFLRFLKNLSSVMITRQKRSGLQDALLLPSYTCFQMHHLP